MKTDFSLGITPSCFHGEWSAVLCGLTLNHLDVPEGVVKRGLLHRSVHVVLSAHSSGHNVSGVSMGPGSPGSAWENREGLVFQVQGAEAQVSPLPSTPAFYPLYSTLVWLHLYFKILILFFAVVGHFLLLRTPSHPLIVITPISTFQTKKLRPRVKALAQN